MKKWREYWLNPNPENRGWSEGKPHQHLCDLNPYGQPIEVIEKAALAEYKNEMDRLREALDDCECTCRVDELPPSQWDCSRCEALESHTQWRNEN